jgi:hypothetical protein
MLLATQDTAVAQSCCKLAERESFNAYLLLVYCYSANNLWTIRTPYSHERVLPSTYFTQYLAMATLETINHEEAE